MNRNYEDLANAIVLQAATDYRKVLRDLKRNPNYTPALRDKAEIESFFRSEWYQTLTPISGELLIKKLKAEVV